MELVVGIFAVIVYFIIQSISSSDEELRIEREDGKVSLTPAEAAQINRIYTLRTSAPDLALQLAAPLWGDAWQLAHASLCSSLLLHDREEEALNLLSHLDAPHRDDALELMLQALVDTGQTDRALALQKRFSVTRLGSPLLRSTLLLADGKIEDARQALSTLALNEERGEQPFLTLARLQQGCNQPELAEATLARAEALLRREATFDFHWNPFLQTLADLQHYPRLLELAQRSDLPTFSIVKVLAAHGQYDDALKVLAEADRSKSYRIDRQELFDHFIAAQQPELMDRLLTAGTLEGDAELLKCYADWHAQRGDTHQAQQLLDRALGAEPVSQQWLLLTMAELHRDKHPSWASSLTRQAERLLAGEKGNASWPSMRLFHLQHLLREQAKRPPNQRDSWSVRQFLGEVERLLADLDAEDRVPERIAHSLLLEELGESQAARTLLAQVRQQLNEQNDLEDTPYYYNELATTLIQFGELEQARELADQGFAEEHLNETLLTAFIDAGRLEEAFELIDLHTLIGACGTSNLQRLHHGIGALKETDPRRYQRLQQQLLDCLNDDNTWRRWSDVQPQLASA
ncbi:MAG: hypothetical protein ACN6O6_12830 [Pseudomonas sp.]|uniref:hypothetical protein n=1 Tax=Pseudomonas sp. TaxID=306 RepID=UPI003D11F5B2